MSYTPDWFTGLLLADTSVNSGSVTLPSASTMIGRMITIKDPKGTYAQRSLTISTLVNSDQFEDGTSTLTLTHAFDYMTFIAGRGSNNIPTWFTVGGSKVSTIQTNILSIYDTNVGTYSQLSLSNGYLLADGNFISTNYNPGFPDNFSVNTLITSTTIVSTFFISSGITTEFLNVGTLSTIENPSFSTFQLWDTRSNAYYTMSLSANTLLAGTEAVITGVEVTVPQNFVTSSLTTSTLIAQQIAAPYQFPVQTLNFQPAQAFSPSSIANMVAWFDASDPAYVLTASGYVTDWIDKSVTCNVVQVTASNRPYYTSGRIQFNNSSSNFLSNDYGSYNNCSSTSIFLVLDTGIFAEGGFLTGWTNEVGIMDCNSASTFTVANQLGFVANPLIHNSKFIGDLRLQDTNALPKNIYEFIINSNTNARNYVTGNLKSSNIVLSNTVVPVAPQGIAVGARYYNGGAWPWYDYMTGNIYEILYYNQALNERDRQTVEGYLAWKWGVQSNLPARHPFRWAQPT